MTLHSDTSRRIRYRKSSSPARIFLPFLAALAVVLAGVLWAPNMTASATGPETIWGTAAPAKLVKHSDRAGVELGTRFTVKTAGAATGVRFYKTTGNTGAHTGTLWSSSGKKLATAKFTSESASGWQTAYFAKPVSLKAGKTYVVSYHAPRGGYAATHNFTGKSRSSSLTVASGAGVFRYGSSVAFPTKKWKKSQYWVDLTFQRAGSKPAANPAPVPTTKPSPTPTTKPSPSPTPTTKPSPSPTPTTKPSPSPTPTTKPSPTPSTPAPSTPPSTSTPTTGFPNASNTGVPAGTKLSNYTGSCTVTAANTVIDAKTINCSLTIRAKGVKITRSVINGTVYGATNGSSSFTISDSNVNIGAREGTGIGDGYFTATRVHVTGGTRSINCFINCTVEYSYVHGQFTDKTGVAHESGVRMGSGSVIRGNTIACDAPDVPPDAGCSAALTGYGDFAVVQNNTIDGNLFIAGSGGYCAYGGSSQGKPYSAGVNNIRFTNNVWQAGSNGKCGYYGPITSFDSKAPGNVWSNNKFDNGKTVSPAN